MTDGREAHYGAREYLVGSLIGYRTWNLLTPPDRLHSISGRAAWTPGVNTARCLPDGVSRAPHPENLPLHDVPALGCHCGFWAMQDLAGLFKYVATENRILGVVEGFGRCIIGSLGFRAEKARIVALVARPNIPTYHYQYFIRKRETPALIETYQRIADCYGVELIPRLTDALNLWPPKRPTQVISA